MSTARRRGLAVSATVVWLLLESAHAMAEAPPEARVTLDAQQAVAVTIYNEDLALVRDRRRIALQAGGNRIAFIDVSAKMKPETALLHGERSDLTIVEQNFDFDLLTPQKLLEKSVGEKVRLVRTNPKNGQDSFEDATVLAVSSGVVLQVGDRIETASPGRIVFNQVPANLRSRPTLVLQLDSGAAGEQAVELSYLTGGLGWKADYVAELASDEKTLDLAGWVTLTNTSGITYRDARLRMVAGDVNLVRPMMQRQAPAMMAMEGAMAAPKMREESLFEYHLYDLDRPTTIAENQTKQVALLSGSGVPVRKEYRFSNISNAYDQRMGESPRTNATVRLAFDNKEEDRLGVPLPKGTVRVYKGDSQAKMLFVGEDEIAHTPKNEKVELTLGQAFDVTARSKQTSYERIGDNVIEVAFEDEIRNAKKEPITVAVIEQLPAEWKVLEESHPHEKARAFEARWTVPVPAEGTTVLSYKVRIKY